MAICIFPSLPLTLSLSPGGGEGDISDCCQSCERFLSLSNDEQPLESEFRSEDRDKSKGRHCGAQQTEVIQQCSDDELRSDCNGERRGQPEAWNRVTDCAHDEKPQESCAEGVPGDVLPPFRLQPPESQAARANDQTSTRIVMNTLALSQGAGSIKP